MSDAEFLIKCEYLIFKLKLKSQRVHRSAGAQRRHPQRLVANDLARTGENHRHAHRPD